MNNKSTTSFFRFILSTILLLLTLIVSSNITFAESNQKKQNQLQKKINSANTSLKDSRVVSNKLKRQVRLAEDNLASISRELYKTEKDIKKFTKKLHKSSKLKAKLVASVDKQKKALAQQMQALYTSGKQSHLRLLLKQDDPSDISRTTKYFEYMNRYRLKQISSIKKKIIKVKKLQDQINKDAKQLQDLQKKQKTKKTKLKSAVKAKEQALKKQRRVVLSKEQRLAKLVKQETRLKGIIESLVRKQKKEARERESARKTALTAKEKRKAKKTAAKKSKSQSKSRKKQQVAKKKRTDKKRLTKVRPHFVSNKPFSSLRGKLSWPVRGSLLHRYGSVRNAKQRWKAVVISAPGGTRVRAVARGKVEYTGRMKGYGYVIIIRHDKNYRSIYGYNRSLYKREGQIVNAGDVIAAVGNSGGLSRTGLYFGIRKRTTHQNPARWCR